MRPYRWLATLMLGVALSWHAPNAAPREVRIGVLAFRAVPQMQAQWAPLGEALSRAYPGNHFQVEAYSYNDLQQAVAARRIDFVLTNPGHYVLIARRLGLSAPLATLVNLEQGQPVTAFGGVILTRAERNDIRSLTDLRGKTVAFTSTDSLGGYQMQAYELLQAGVDPRRQIRPLPTGMPHDKVVEAVLSGRADAGFVRSGLLESLQQEGKLRPGQLKVLNAQSLAAFPVTVSTRLYPEWPFAALPHTDRTLMRKVASFLLKVEEDKALTKALHIHGFDVAADYTPVVELLRTLRMPPFDDVPMFTWSDVWQRYRIEVASGLAAGCIILSLGFWLLLINRRLQTERQRVEAQAAALRESELRFRTVAHYTYDWEYWQAADRRILYMSPSCERVTGYRAEEFIANPRLLIEIVHPEDRPLIEAHVAHAWHSQGEEQLDFRIVRKDGEVRWIAHVCKAVYDAQGQFNGRRVSNRDVTERKAYEVALMEARDAAESAARAKSEFLANMSHEIRTPMNAIVGLTRLALDKRVSKEVRDYLEKIAAASESLLSILNDVLDYSRMEAGKLALDPQPFHLHDLLDDLRNLFAVQAEAKGLEFRMEVDPAIPTGLKGDVLRLRQVLSNLLGNAIKFTERGHVTLRLELLRRTEREAWVRFSVSDSGIGIRPEDQARLFKPFSQADGSITRRFGGTGLGLAISQRLLALMDSSMRVDSAPGKGATFSFVLRLDGVADLPPHATEHTQPKHAAGTLSVTLHTLGAALQGRRILVAEDNHINQQVVKEFLKLAGARVDVAGNGAEALAMIERNHYDAILMDVQMPEMSGDQATARIRAQARFAALPIIALTAGVTPEERARCKAAGMNDFVAKPIDPETLIRVLNDWIGRSDRAAASASSSLPPTGQHGELAQQGEPASAIPPLAPTHEVRVLPGFELERVYAMVGDDETLITELLHIFREDAANAMERLEALLAARDYPAAHRLVHTLKGSAGNLGAMELHAAAAALDDGLRQGRLDPQALDRFRAALDSALQALQKLD
ncbi:MAG: PhnD/SsuA/transferrin family substrate-binding protein [Methylophilaceae bacterium]|nr:PhnD/SsuA/transferrin family substrate-binding protein [Methylophilaceae bacterium]